MSVVVIITHIPTGKQIRAYKHKERPTYVNAIDYTTEYPIEEVRNH